ncbi:hypothetical protein D3C79_986960 [compost metagenome]
MLAHDDRINDFDAFAQFNALSRSYALDLFRVAQQDAFRDTAFGTDGCRFHGAWLVAFRQDDTFAGFTRQLGQLVAECRWRQTT